MLCWRLEVYDTNAKRSDTTRWCWLGLGSLSQHKEYSTPAFKQTEGETSVLRTFKRSRAEKNRVGKSRVWEEKRLVDHKSLVFNYFQSTCLTERRGTTRFQMQITKFDQTFGKLVSLWLADGGVASEFRGATFFHNVPCAGGTSC